MLDGDINARMKVMKCPLEASLSIMSGRWKHLIVFHLHEKERRYSELKALLPNPSDRMLSRSLKELARDGLVIRQVRETGSVQVTYRLTSAGHDLFPALKAMCDWALKNWDIGGA